MGATFEGRVNQNADRHVETDMRGWYPYNGTKLNLTLPKLFHSSPQSLVIPQLESMPFTPTTIRCEHTQLLIHYHWYLYTNSLIDPSFIFSYPLSFIHSASWIFLFLFKMLEDQIINPDYGNRDNKDPPLNHKLQKWWNNLWLSWGRNIKSMSLSADCWAIYLNYKS